MRRNRIKKAHDSYEKQGSRLQISVPAKKPDPRDIYNRKSIEERDSDDMSEIVDI